MSAGETAFGILVDLLAGDIAEAARKKLFRPTPEEALRLALAEYLLNEKQNYPKDWEEIKAAVKGCVIQGNPYRDVISTGVSRKDTVEQWMNQYHGANPEVVRKVYEGCFRIIKDHIKAWDGFTPDMLMHLAESNRVIISLLSEWKAKQGREDSTRKAAVQDSTQNYLDRWTELLFLNKPGDIDDDIPPVRLGEVHTPYRYKVLNTRTGKETITTDEAALMKRLAFPGGHLVLGDPGIGKSTLISWYLNKSGCDPKKTPVYVLSRFQLTGKERRPGATLLKQMGRERDDLKGCTLFLDGLDECGLTPGQRADFLNRLNEEWGTHFSWVITCRLNYIGQHDLNHLRISRLTLLPLNPSQRGDFLDKYEAAAKQPIPADKRAALMSDKLEGEFGSPFGIPLILYMAAAMESITVTENSTLVSVYDQLFNELFQRNYDAQAHKLMDKEELQQSVREMSRQIALWMFHHQPEEAFIPEKVYREIEAGFGNSFQEYRIHQIGSFFRLLRITEGEKELCFIHRTMYEYFVADGFADLAVNAEYSGRLGGIIALYWHKNRFGESAGKVLEQYVRQKITQRILQLFPKKQSSVVALWEQAGLQLLQKGMQRCCHNIKKSIPEYLYPKQGKDLKEEREQENNVFRNLCFLLVWVHEITKDYGCVFQYLGKHSDALISAIRHCIAEDYPVSCPNFYLAGANLFGAVLEGSNFSGAYLANAGLSCAKLSYAKLSNAVLFDAFLSGTDFSNADLRGAKLLSTNLIGAIIYGADLTGAYLENATLTEEQIKSLGYQMLSSCNFNRIHVYRYAQGFTTYSRSAFFAHFFPDQ